MRFARRAPLLLIALAALLAGCGGNQIAADEVPVDPPVLTIPTDADAAPGAGTADPGAAETDEEDDGAEATATPTPEAAAGGTTGAGTTSGGTTGGATAQPQATATATPAPNNTGGAQADEGLDQFCADNPGAC